MTRAERFALALTGELEAKDFVIYSEGYGAWFAFNCVDGRRVDLAGAGRTFSDAVDEFDRLIGPYYATR